MTVSVKVEFHGIEENGTCLLSSKEGEVLVVTFSDGTITEAPLSQKALMQLLRMKLTQKPKPAVKPEQKPQPNGPAPLATAVPVQK